MGQVHVVVGFAVVAIFTLGWIWGGAAALLRRDPGERFWTWLVVAQVVAGLQALVGVVLLLQDRWPSTWRHLVYGFGPLAILLIAHGMSRELQRQIERGVQTSIRPWMLFAVASFICFGLSMMALATGLRII